MGRKALTWGYCPAPASPPPHRACKTPVPSPPPRCWKPRLPCAGHVHVCRMPRYPTLQSKERLSPPHPPALAQKPQPGPAYSAIWVRGVAPRTSSSLFKVLEANAEVMPAFLDWTKD